jgi:hypothetical protein
MVHFCSGLLSQELVNSLTHHAQGHCHGWESIIRPVFGSFPANRFPYSIFLLLVSRLIFDLRTPRSLSTFAYVFCVFYSRPYQIFWKAVGLQRVPSTSWIQLRSYLEERASAPVKKTEITAGIQHADHAAPHYPQKFALTSPTSGDCSVDIVRLRTKAT